MSTGSFRPVAATEHLYSDFNFAGSVVETVGKSLRHSCRSELHLIPLFPGGQTMPSSQTLELVESPAYCLSHRFAACATGLKPRPFGLSRYGAIPARAGRGLPTALPAVYRLVPYRG